MKKCPNCGGSNNDLNSFCEWCGSKIPEGTESKSDYFEDSNDSFGSNANTRMNMNHGMNKNYGSNYSSNSSRNNYYSAENDDSGVMALIFGILSIFCCAIIFGPLAIVKGNESNSSVGKAGKILGIIGLCLWALGIFLNGLNILIP